MRGNRAHSRAHGETDFPSSLYVYVALARRSLGRTARPASQRLPGTATERRPPGRPPTTDRKREYAGDTASWPKHINAFGPSLLANRCGHIRLSPLPARARAIRKYIRRPTELRRHRPKRSLSRALRASNNSKSLPGRSPHEDLRPRAVMPTPEAQVGAGSASLRQLLRTPSGVFSSIYVHSRLFFLFRVVVSATPQGPSTILQGSLRSGSFPLLCHRYRALRGALSP